MKHKFSVSLTLALILAMLVTSLAMADKITADGDTLTAGPNISVTSCIAELTFNGSATINYQGGQHFASGSELTVTVTADSGIAASGPSTTTLPNPWSSGGAHTFSISTTVPAGVANGTYKVTVAVSDGTSTLDDFFNVNVTCPTVPSDSSPPVITPSISGMLGNNGWYVSDVTVTWSVVDNESAISSSSGCDPTTINADTAGTTLTCTATSAGGTASESVTIKRDATNPEVSLVGGPANGESYYFGFVPAAPTCTASDATSGLDGDCSVSGYGDTVGNHAVTASAFDNAGNKGTDSASYTVLAWTLNGFFRPVEMDNVWNTVKGGSTVPLKFNVFAGATELTDVSVVKSFTAVKVACEVGGDEDAIEFTTTGGTSLRYDTTDGQFIQNWKTPKTTGCYRVTMMTDDGSSLVAFFKLK